MTVTELIDRLSEVDSTKEIAVWDVETQEATTSVAITETSDGKILIW